MKGQEMNLIPYKQTIRHSKLKNVAFFLSCNSQETCVNEIIPFILTAQVPHLILSSYQTRNRNRYFSFPSPVSCMTLLLTACDFKQHFVIKA